MNRLSIKVKTGILLIACLTAMSSCKDNYFSGDEYDDSTLLQINISGCYGSRSRASETGFADKDVMGIFIADYANNQPTSLGDGKLHADNIKFTYSDESDKWTGSTQLYWNDKTTPIDVYGYYPFDSSISAPLHHSFRVATRQNEPVQSGGTMSAYEQSDFLWAKTENVKPTDRAITLEYKHALAGVTVRLEAGEGFAAEEFAKVEKIVWIDNTVPDALINLEAQTVVADGGKCERIYPLIYNFDYRAVVVPQSVEAGKSVIGLTVDGKNYELVKSTPITYVQGKMHTFTIKIDKSSDSGDYIVTLLPESITAWVDDPAFHDGIIYQYLVVNVSEAGTLREALETSGMAPAKISALKICGPINADDRDFIGRIMENCEALNLADAVMADDELSIWTPNWMDDGHVHHIVYPTVPFKKLGNAGGRVRGNQVIPEGVEEIHGWVAATGTNVSFPSTLKRIGDVGYGLRGELRFPEGLESFGGISGYFSGTLSLPETLKELGSIEGRFNSGLVIPQGVKNVPYHSFDGCTFMGTLELSEGIEIIGESGFASCGFTGELVLPESLKEIGQWGFTNNKFTAIIWPKDLSVIGNYAFEGLNRMQGCLTIPDKVRSINEGTFKDCSMITALELHEDVDYIGREAFCGCERLTTISCKAETPPLAHASAFLGVGMDYVILEVPASAVSAYKTAPVWKEFKKITPYKDFSCYPSQIQALNNRKSQTVVIGAKGEWKLGAHPDWCIVSPTSGSGKTPVSIVVSTLSSGAGDRRGAVEFELSDDTAVVSVEVSQYDYEYAEDTAITLQKHTKGSGIPVYFLGDGWNGADIASGAYIQQCEEDMEHFFGIAPYDRLRDYFDVYSLIALSQESGINTIYNYRDTRFNTIYSSQLIPEESTIFDYMKNEVYGVSITDHDIRKGLTVLIPNTTDYGSVTYYYDGEYTISVCPPTNNPYPMDNRGIIQHEACGHGFGKLGDELITKNLFAPAGVSSLINAMHEKEWYMNLATSSNMNTVPWSDMIFDPRYSDRVDVFEGGMDYTRGVFRPESNSCMNLGIPYFNSISRLYITKRILTAAGEEFDYNQFYDNDTFEWGNTLHSRNIDEDFMTGIPNHKMPVVITADESLKLIKAARKQQETNIKNHK